MPHVSDAREAVLPNRKSHPLVTEELPQHIVSKGSLNFRQVRVALEVVSDAVLVLYFLVWQKIMCKQDATKFAIT